MGMDDGRAGAAETQGEDGGAMTAGQVIEAGAHRPSRRDAIVSAAIRVFANKGFADASVQDVADEAQVVPTAVYYHFAGKEELFEVALARVMAESDRVVAAVRADDDPGDAVVFERVIDAVWKWSDEHTDEARLLYLQLPGATPRAREMTRHYQEHHTQRAYAYLADADAPRTRRAAAARHASHTLAVRTMINLTISVHMLRLEGGPVGAHSARATRKALAAVCTRIITGA